MTPFDKIRDLIGIDVREYFDEIINFYNVYDSQISQYYRDSTVLYPKEAFQEFDRLKSKCNLILEKLGFYKGTLNNMDFWDILDKLDSIYLKFDVVANYSKFYRVTALRNQNYDTIKETKVLRQHQTIESLATENNTDWASIAVNNYVNEEDYTLSGGKKLTLKSSNTAITDGAITAIIDIAIGENLLGKDLPECIEIDDNENDLVVLNPEDTFIHTIKRLLAINQGTIPEFPDVGVQKEILSEATRGEGYLFPILTRQISQCLATDDTIAEFSITNIQRVEDNLFFEIKAKSRLENKVFTINTDFK